MPKLKKAHIIIKNREFDEIVVFSAGSENSSVRVARFAFEITLSRTITLTLLLACSFPPRVHSIPRGPQFPRIFRFLEKLKKAQIYFIKNREFDGFWGSWQVLTRARTLAYVTEQGSAKTPKRRKLSVFNRVDRFLSGNPKYRYKACEKCRGDAAQKDNSDLANTVT